MADIFLNQGESLLGGPFSNARYFGNVGSEGIGLTDTATNVTISQTIEKITLSGASSSYLFQQQGNQLAVFDGSTMVAKITLQSDDDGSQIQFSNGLASAKVSAAGMTLGGATVSSAAPGAVTNPTFASSAAASESIHSSSADAPLSTAEISQPLEATASPAFLLTDIPAGQFFG